MDAIKYHSLISKQFDNHYYIFSLFQERFKVWTSLIDIYLKEGEEVLDAGCGNGIFSYYMAQKGNKVTAIDGSEEMIGICKNKLKENKEIDINFLIDKLPFNKIFFPEKYDFIISSSVLEYISDYKLCLEEFKILLKLNGLLVISLPNKKSIYRKLEKFTYYLFKRPKYLEFVKNMSTAEELNKIMASIGFEIIENRFYSSQNYLNRIIKFLLIPKNYSSSLILGVYKKIS